MEKSMKHANTTNEKKRIAELIHLLNKLNEIIDESSEKSIESGLEMLGHKLNVIVNESVKYTDTMSFNPNELLQQNRCEYYYLEDLLIQCGLIERDNKKSTKLSTQDRAECTHELVSNVIENFVWPDIFKRIEHRMRRPQITVDLHRLTSEEKSMIEDVASECIETFMEKSLIL